MREATAAAAAAGFLIITARLPLMDRQTRLSVSVRTAVGGAIDRYNYRCTRQVSFVAQVLFFQSERLRHRKHRHEANFYIRVSIVIE